MTNQRDNIPEIIENTFEKYISGHFNEMESLFNSIPPDIALDGVLKLKFKIVEAYLLMTKGDLEKSKQIISDIISFGKSINELLYVIDSYIILIEINVTLRHLKESLKLIEEIRTLLNNITNNSNEEIVQRKIWLKISEGRINYGFEKVNTALNLFQEALDLSIKIKNQYNIAVSTRLVATMIYQEEVEKSIDLLFKTLQIFKEINNPPQIAWNLLTLGIIYFNIGNYDQSLSYLQKSLEIRENIGNKQTLWGSFLNIARVYEQLDNIVKAMEYYDKCLEIALELKINYLIIASYGWRLAIFIELGDIKIAENLLEKYIKLCTESGNQYQKIFAINFFKSRLYDMKGRIQEALEFMDKAASYLANDYIGQGAFIDYYFLNLCYFNCIRYSLELKDRSLTYSYLKKIKELLDKAEDKLQKEQIKENLDLTESMILKESLRIKDKAKAQEFLESTIKDTKKSYWYKNLAMIQLCEIYLDEYVKYGDPETLVDLKNLVTSIQEKAKSRNSNYLLIEAMIIQAKLLLIEGEINSAENLLNETIIIAQKKNIKILENEVKNELDQLKEWNRNSFDKITTQERIQKAQLADYFKEAEKYLGNSKLNRRI